MSFGSFKNVTNKLYIYISDIKQDLALNNLQRLMCHKYGYLFLFYKIKCIL